METIHDLLRRLTARSDNAYVEYIGLGRRDECLGREIKMERGWFGEAELKAHCAVAEKLGRHRALAEVCRDIEVVLEAVKEGSDALPQVP